LIKHILDTYGILMNRKQVQAAVERIREEGEDESSSVITGEVPKRNLSVA
jgi:hypothetical protein